MSKHALPLALIATMSFLLALSSCEKPLKDIGDDPKEMGNEQNHHLNPDDWHHNDSVQGGGNTPDASGEPSDSDNDDNGIPYDETDIIDDDNNDNDNGEKRATLTVDEFIAGNVSGGVFVEGYIVGDCTKSWKYAETFPPFTHQQALLLADRAGETRKEYVMTLELKSGSQARSALNLVDHPYLLGHRIKVFGYWGKYLGLPGIKDVGSSFWYEP